MPMMLTRMRTTIVEKPPSELFPLVLQSATDAIKSYFYACLYVADRHGFGIVSVHCFSADQEPDGLVRGGVF
jgi:hypothetical protein